MKPIYVVFIVLIGLGFFVLKKEHTKSSLNVAPIAQGVNPIETAVPGDLAKESASLGAPAQVVSQLLAAQPVAGINEKEILKKIEVGTPKELDNQLGSVLKSDAPSQALKNLIWADNHAFPANEIQILIQRVNGEFGRNPEAAVGALKKAAPLIVDPVRRSMLQAIGLRIPGKIDEVKTIFAAHQ